MTRPPGAPAASGRELNREILALAWPAFLALVAEPLFLLADAAIVGHLGTPALAGLGIAGVVLSTVVGLCIFLAYGTTAAVARHVGAGDRARALAQGIDGLWLAVLIGVAATLLGVVLTGPLVAAFGADPAVTEQAATYLRIAFLGTTPLLLMLAATGVLRGLQDTRTPLVVAVAGNLLNIVLNLVLVYGLGPLPRLDIAGSALGSVLAQALSAAALVAVVVRGARRSSVSLRPDRPGIRAAAVAGVPLVIRTLTLRAALIATTYAVVVATDSADRAIAAHQLAFTIWSFLAFVLDSIAIAAQALTGRYLGAGQAGPARAMARRMIRWGAISGVVTGLGLAVVSPWLGGLFTPDPAVRHLLTGVLLLAALGQPLAGVVFVLDGVLIGAGDGRYLARAGLVVLAIYAPLVLGWAALAAESAHGSAQGSAQGSVQGAVQGAVQTGLIGVWLVFTVVFMGARAVVLLRRERREDWLVLGGA